MEVRDRVVCIKDNYDGNGIITHRNGIIYMIRSVIASDWCIFVSSEVGSSFNNQYGFSNVGFHLHFIGESKLRKLKLDKIDESREVFIL